MPFAILSTIYLTMSDLYVWFYCLRIFDALSVVVAFYLLYFSLGAVLKMHHNCLFSFVSLLLFGFSIYIILSLTIFSRTASEYKIVLLPFYSFIAAKDTPEMWRQLFMNIVLFVPFGAFGASALSEKLSFKARIAIMSSAGCVLSLMIESVQYFCSLGEAWTDDVLCNALGAFLGATVIVATNRLMLKQRKRTDY